MPCNFMWRIFYFLQLAQLLELLEYSDEAVLFSCEAEAENNMAVKDRTENDPRKKQPQIQIA